VLLLFLQYRVLSI